MMMTLFVCDGGNDGNDEPLHRLIALLTEPAQRLSPTQVQELERLAEVMGRLCQLLSFLLQKLSGCCSTNTCTKRGLERDFFSAVKAAGESWHAVQCCVLAIFKTSVQ